MVVVPALGVLPEHGAFRAPLNSGAILPVKVPMPVPAFNPVHVNKCGATFAVILTVLVPFF